MHNRLGRISLYVILSVGALFMLFPFVWTLITSVSPGASLTTTPQLPAHPPLSPYAALFRVFFQIMLPLIRPALATLAVFAFLNTWNSFLWPLIILRDPLMQTLPVALSSLQGQYSTQWDVLMAGSVVSIIPMFALYVF